jgi:GNAT superfamily N-acetyltransferase
MPPNIPALAIVVLPEYRGNGIGTTFQRYSIFMNSAIAWLIWMRSLFDVFCLRQSHPDLIHLSYY